MIKKFETGKYYVCHLKERPADWNSEGRMDFLLDGKPHLCVKAEGMCAGFKRPENYKKDERLWCFSNKEKNFSKVRAPKKEKNK